MSARFEQEVLEHVKASHDDILKEIRETKKLPEEDEEKLTDVINEFKKGFSATDGSSVVVNEADTEAMDEEDVEKESVKVRKPARSRTQKGSGEARWLQHCANCVDASVLRVRSRRSPKPRN